ncbi:hypothetical protein [Priestia taiwanensis]|uniref:Nitroreductase domain-containing protein n=1 Tax=Priestia taiwanensis TaxID=1347902 RepID=A0A917AKZ5_9BACI|nr:hypothetical protein [Priestia taiwanensis]MBM7362043.1 hypothetical protein [Priestia taiwanensis]GGE59009.1 hypothetical protein GCM10007140_06680 [Priestia taiwanensis]
MYYLRDFMGELSRNYEYPMIKQELPYFLSTYSKVKEIETGGELSQYERLILSLNDYVRVEQYTHYKVHKGYPSPRSIYPLKLFLVTYDENHVSKNDRNGQYEFYRNNCLDVSIGDIIIGFEDSYPQHYEYIKKSLLLLEMGHLLYNILFIAKEYGKRYTYRVLPNLGILLHAEDNTDNEYDEKNIEAFLQSCQERNSGPYLYPLTPFKNERAASAEIDEKMVYDLIFNFFSISEIRQAVSIQFYHNNGEGIYRKEDGHEDIHYRQLNELYPYINFYGTSHFVIISLNHDVFRQGDSTPYLLMVGMIAQHICLRYSSKERYCRPIKSFRIEEVEKVFSMNGTNQTPYYCLIAGDIE